MGDDLKSAEAGRRLRSRRRSGWFRRALRNILTADSRAYARYLRGIRGCERAAEREEKWHSSSRTEKMANRLPVERRPDGSCLQDERSGTRHIALTITLVALLVIHAVTCSVASLVAFRQFTMLRASHAALPTGEFGTLIAPILLSFVALVSVARMFWWKRTAFAVFSAVSVLMFCRNILGGMPLPQSALGLAGLAVLYAALHLGGEPTGWTKLNRPAPVSQL